MPFILFWMPEGPTGCGDKYGTLRFQLGYLHGLKWKPLLSCDTGVIALHWSNSSVGSEMEGKTVSICGQNQAFGRFLTLALALSVKSASPSEEKAEGAGSRRRGLSPSEFLEMVSFPRCDSVILEFLMKSKTGRVTSPDQL